MNEVLRRKLFNKVMNANQPAGILASSPEMVETVQRRANGGSYKAPTSNILSNALRSIRGLPTIRQAGNTSGAGMPEFTGTSGGTSMQRQSQMGDAIFGGIDTPEYLRFVESIKGLPYAQQVKAMQEAGYGATIGTGPIQPVLDAAQSINQGVVDVVKGIGSFGQKATDALGNQLSIAGKRAAEDLDFMGNARRARQQSRINKQIDKSLLAEDDDQGSMTTIAIPAPLGDDNVDDDYIGGVGKGILSNQLPEGQVDEFGNLLGGIDGRSVPTRPADVPVIAAAEKEVAESNEPQKTASNISTTIDKLRANLDSSLAGSKPTEKVNPQQAAKPSTFAAFAGDLSKRTEVEEVDLAKIEELVSETTGYDPEKSGEAKKGAFWNAVITAGLSIAAGESGNNLTNIAKGLGFAFNQYGKAVGELTAQDRADQKEARVLRLNLIKDEKTANIAKAAADDAFNQRRIQNELAFKKNADDETFRTATLANQMMQIRSTFEINALEAISRDDYYRQTGEINQGTLDATVAKNLTDATGDVGKMLLQFGFGERNEDGTIIPTEKGRDVLGPDFIANFVTDFTAKETALTSNSGAVGKDIVFAGALGRVMSGSRDPQDIAGAMSSDIFKSVYNVTGSIDETINELKSEFPIQQQSGGGQGGQQFTVGQIVNQAGSKYRVTGFNQDGSPITEEIK